MAWARNARVSESLLNLLLPGHIVPVGFKDGEPAFRTTTGTLSLKQARKLEAALQAIDEREVDEAEVATAAEEG